MERLHPSAPRSTVSKMLRQAKGRGLPTVHLYLNPRPFFFPEELRTVVTHAHSRPSALGSHARGGECWKLPGVVGESQLEAFLWKMCNP